MINWLLLSLNPRGEEEKHKVYFVEHKQCCKSQFIIFIARKSICDMEWKLIAIFEFVTVRIKWGSSGKWKLLNALP